MITAKEILMGRDKNAPLNNDQIYNLLDLLPRVNVIRFAYGKPMYVSSGYRPPDANKAAGGAPNSTHLSCQAVDFADSNGELKKWCIANMDMIKKAGLYMEHPDHTPTWVHLQSRPTKNNPFIP